ncbi:nuclear transport factor 2 domain-containing protein [Cryptosporidium serpentis]
MAESSNAQRDIGICSASKIADFFVTEYYSRLKKDPTTLYELYHDSGSLTWAGYRPDVLLGNKTHLPSVLRAESKEKIRSAINLLNLNDCTTYVEVLECSRSICNSFCITTKGRMYIGDSEGVGRGFVQNFLLTEIRPRWYFIRNDCLLFLDSDLPLLPDKILSKHGVDSHIPDTSSNITDQQIAHETATTSKVEVSSNSQVCTSDNLEPTRAVTHELTEPPSFQTEIVNMSGDTLNSGNLNDCKSRSKYVSTSYAGKLMGGLMNPSTKVKGYVIPAHDNKRPDSSNIMEKANNESKASKDTINRRKIFVHSIPQSITDSQIREAVQNQLKIHGGGYIIDIERARMNNKHWGILELDSELSCKTLLMNNLYLGGVEVSIERWKPPQSSNTKQPIKHTKQNNSNHMKH